MCLQLIGFLFPVASGDQTLGNGVAELFLPVSVGVKGDLGRGVAKMFFGGYF